MFQREILVRVYGYNEWILNLYIKKVVAEFVSNDKTIIDILKL